MSWEASSYVLSDAKPIEAGLEDASRGTTYFRPHSCEEVDTGVTSYFAAETLLVCVSVVTLTPTG